VCRYDVPLVADIHFQPKVAMMVADAFEKIRINPGNFADGRKTFEVINYEDPAQFKKEQEEIREVSVLAAPTEVLGFKTWLFVFPGYWFCF
jgi:4-hydroxy-3-methylbut-2-en-1-yl diphosphate synthase IspG/GcpE